MSHYQTPVLKLYAKYFGGINGPYSESIMLYLLHTHCSQTFGNDHGQVDNNWHHHLQPELDSSLSLHLYCFQNLFALLLGNPSKKKMWKIPHLGGGPDPGIFHISKKKKRGV